MLLPISTHTYTIFPQPTLFRSRRKRPSPVHFRCGRSHRPSCHRRTCAPCCLPAGGTLPWSWSACCRSTAPSLTPGVTQRDGAVEHGSARLAVLHVGAEIAFAFKLEPLFRFGPGQRRLGTPPFEIGRASGMETVCT